MIEIKNVKKVYNSKSKYNCVALNNISFNLPSKGFVFICGKSGSGKSTLLNILGGLDNIDEGKIVIDGNNLSSFNNKDFDNYRNSYVGFIFQDFCLIDNFNVYDNVKLSLQLKGEKNNDNIEKILESVDLKGFGQRYPKELSGGQKQRVAIARCLVKNPKLILADEPTGNLDNKTSKQILSLLKELSEERLVVVVSHNIKDALEYGDRIIELSDGNVISDREKTLKKKYKLIEDNLIVLPNNQNLSESDLKKINNRIKKGNVKIIKEPDEFNDSKQPIEIVDKPIEKPKKMSIKTSTKLASKFLKGNKLGIFVTSTLIVLLTLLLCFGQMFSSFDKKHLINQALEQSDNLSFSMNKGYYEENIFNKTLKTNKTIKITDEEINKFYQNGYDGKIYKLYNSAIISEYSKNPVHPIEFGNLKDDAFNPFSFYATKGYGVLETDEEFLIKLFGKDGKLQLLAGSLDEESNNNGVIITDYLADSILNYHPQIFMLGNEDKYDNLVNLGIVGYRFNISAIIDTGYKDKYKEVIDEYKYMANLNTKTEIKQHIKSLVDKKIYKDFVNDVTKYLTIGYSLSSDYKSLLMNNISEMGNFYRLHNANFIYNNKIVAEEVGWAYSSNSNLTDNEIYIGAKIYNMMFGTNVSYEDQTEFSERIVTIKLYASNRQEDDMPLYTREYIIKGLTPHDDGGVHTSLSEFQNILDLYIYPYALYFDKANDAALLHDIGEEVGFYSSNHYFKSVYTIINIIGIFSEIFSLAIIVLILLEVLLIVSFSIRTIKKKLYEIGVLRALGGTILQVSKTFILQVIYLVLFTCLISTVSIILLNQPLNYMLATKLSEFTNNKDIATLSILNFNPFILITVYTLILIVSLSSSIIPIISIKKVKPINIIKNKE